MRIKVRIAEARDAAGITRILQALGWFAHLSTERFEVAKGHILDHLSLCKSDGSHSIYVAEDEDGENILGYISVHWLPYLFLPGPEGYISELFVHAAGRNQGIGTQLLDKVKQEAIERGCLRLALINNRTRESYQRRFYEKQGWVEREEIANFIYKLNR